MRELFSPWNSLGQNIGVGGLSLLQGIFPTQGSNPSLLHCRRILYQLSHKGKLKTWLSSFYASVSLSLKIGLILPTPLAYYEDQWGNTCKECTRCSAYSNQLCLLLFRHQLEHPHFRSPSTDQVPLLNALTELCPFHHYISQSIITHSCDSTEYLI